EMRCSPEETLDLLPKLGVLLAQADVAECFRQRPGRTMAAEQELCDSAGRLVRMDRVVADPHNVMVIDFKTGEEQPAEHEAQLRDYMAILADVYPGRRVAALAAYVDLGTVRRFS
ncbi:MAG TPA: PD-(D/E)XK nuclease family protein, partial [Spirochaetia bacterium]|nr:PD-(D/E)XK nuclease family protein [Spirochaetia bacterium]